VWQSSRAYREESSNHSPDRRIAALAGRQHGVVSVPQLRAAGLSKDAIYRRVAAGHLHRLRCGVYALGHLALTGRSRSLAVVLACGPAALLSHRAAGQLWEFVPGDSPIEVTVRHRRKPGPDVIVHRSRIVHPDDRAVVDAVPVTSVARTLVDLAEVFSERRLADAVHEAEVRRLFDLTGVEQALARVPGRPGRHRLRRVLSAYDPQPPFTRNDAEGRFLELCARHSLPAPQANVSVGGCEVDFLWPEARLAVEVDGAAAHHTRRAFHEDRRRDRRLAALGIQVLRVTWRDLAVDAATVASELRWILACRRSEPRPPPLSRRSARGPPHG
jgi:hypothetical protein